jgi:hypothetical protein
MAGVRLAAAGPGRFVCGRAGGGCILERGAGAGMFGLC